MGGHSSRDSMLTRRRVVKFRDKALDLGQRLIHAFDTDHGLPNPVVNLRTYACCQPRVLSHANAWWVQRAKRDVVLGG